MQALISSTILTMVIGLAPQQERWRKDYGEALEAARISQRPLLVILEDPTDPNLCIRLLRPGDGTREAELLKHFELCRVDVTTDYGKRVAEAYGASTFPYSVITDQSCRRILFRGVGQFSRETWRRTLTFYRGDLPSSRMRSMPAQMADGGRGIGASRGLFRHPGLSAARRAARRNRRPLLVFITMPGCLHCDKMKAETYANRTLSDAIARRFESVVVDQTDDPDWVHSKSVEAFPTTLVMSPGGQTLDRIVGFKTAGEMRSLLSRTEKDLVGQR